MKLRQRRVVVYRDESLSERVALVRYNARLDRFDGRDWSSGEPGKHRGLTRLADGRYALLVGSDIRGERDFGYVVSPEEALQEILKSDAHYLLSMDKFHELAQLYDRLTKENANLMGELE